MSNKPVVENLLRVLANTHALALKTQNYHWNVTGVQFAALHTLFEGQYDALAEATDEIAERVRALGEKVPASYKVFSEHQLITDGNHEADVTFMLEDLAASHKRVAKLLKEGIETAERSDDASTADLLTTRLTEHDKMAWMLEASRAGL
jgi:starvation-inducible DNA-binding protein